MATLLKHDHSNIFLTGEPYLPNSMRDTSDLGLLRARLAQPNLGPKGKDLCGAFYI